MKSVYYEFIDRNVQIAKRQLIPGFVTEHLDHTKENQARVGRCLTVDSCYPHLAGLISWYGCHSKFVCPYLVSKKYVLGSKSRSGQLQLLCMLECSF